MGVDSHCYVGLDGCRDEGGGRLACGTTSGGVACMFGDAGAL